MDKDMKKTDRIKREDNLSEESENAELNSDTSVMQDLFDSIGIGFLKSTKKINPVSRNNLKVKESEVPATDKTDIKTNINETQIPGVQNENLKESCAEIETSIEDQNQEFVKFKLSERYITDAESEIPRKDMGLALNLQEHSGYRPAKSGFSIRKFFAVPVIILLAFLGVKFYGFITEPRPPSEDVVAAYSGKNLTKQELMAYINSKGYREQEHSLCERHGFDHNKCDKTEKCETHPIHSLESYKQIIKMIAVQKMVEDWAKQSDVTQKDEVQHDFKHLMEEVNLDSLVNKVHEDQLSPDKIDKLEIQKYYDANKDKYKEKPFSEVEDEIRSLLAAEKDQQFFPEYIEKLKKNAGLSVNYDILRVDPPTETEMRSYYDKNTDKYAELKKAKILEIKVNITDAEEESRKKAQEALTKINSGESFETVAKAYSDSDEVGAYYIKQGDKGATFEDRVFNLQINGISDVFTDGNSFFIVKLLEKQDKRQKTFEEALETVKAEVTGEKEDKQYELKKDEALFNVHGKRFTLGEFKTEFKELSPETQAQFADFEAKKNLIDQLITKELLLEETVDEAADDETSREIGDLKIQYINQMLHKEKIDEKIGEISEEEILKAYEKNKSLLIDPPKAKISLIRVEQGSSDAEKSRARQRIDEAIQKIKSGTEFGEVAKEYSSDPTSSAGGELKEWIYNDVSLDPVLKKNIFSLKTDAVSAVFEYEGGYYIFKLRQKEDKKQMALDEVKQELKEALLEEKHYKMEAELEDELLRQSKLTIYNSSLKKILKEQTEIEK